MKKMIPIIITIIILLTPITTLAMNIPGYEGGIQNESNYKEVIFVTGKPIIMEGTLTIKTKEKDNTITETYRYDLENPGEDAKLSRNITIITTLEPKGNQTSSTRTLDKYTETININGKRYEVRHNKKNQDYPWNQSTITHNTPLLEYNAGDMSARKTYTIDRGAEKVTVESHGKLVGYESPWSATETQSIEHIINYENPLNPDDNWEGSATVEVSYNRTKDYSYSENVPRQISFREGVTITETYENVLKYIYDLPRMTNNTIVKGRNLGKNSFTMDTVPYNKRLSIPAARDILGHEREGELFLLASMEALALNSNYLGPDTPISRGDFAKSIVNSMDIQIEKEEETRSRRSRRRREEPEPPLFRDVDKDHRNFDYIEEVGKRGIMLGIDKDKFYPDEPLSRAEAYATIIRLLGLENNLAPRNKNYTTGYKDDANIPLWAKDYIYIAKELDMVDGGDYFYPNRPITKGESSKLIVDLINYMQEDLRTDYRENLLNN